MNACLQACNRPELLLPGFEINISNICMCIEQCSPGYDFRHGSPLQVFKSHSSLQIICSRWHSMLSITLIYGVDSKLVFFQDGEREYKKGTQSSEDSGNNRVRRGSNADDVIQRSYCSHALVSTTNPDIF